MGYRGAGKEAWPRTCCASRSDRFGRFAQSLARRRVRGTREILRTPRTQLRAGSGDDTERAGTGTVRSADAPGGPLGETRGRVQNVEAHMMKTVLLLLVTIG